MTQNERKMQSIENELAKIAKSLERCEASLAKKIEKCEKLNCNWTLDEHREIMRELYARHEGESVIPFGNDDDLITSKQENAWFEMYCKSEEVNDYKERLANTESRYAKITETVRKENEAEEKFRLEYSRLSEMERKFLAEKAQKEYEEWVKEFTAECLKDGIIISNDEYLKPSNSGVYGLTPSGKKFSWYMNNGFTDRSWHCYTLRINGRTIFTSGEWWRCYNVVKNS